MNRHKKLLLLGLIVLEDVLMKHRKKCDEWTYSPKLKCALTKSRAFINECLTKLPGDIYCEDSRLLKSKLKDYERGIIAKEGDVIVDLVNFENLPEDFKDDIVTLQRVIGFIETKLMVTVDRTCKKEFELFRGQYKVFENFLKNEIFI